MLQVEGVKLLPTHMRQTPDSPPSRRKVGSGGAAVLLIKAELEVDMAV